VATELGSSEIHLPLPGTAFLSARQQHPMDAFFLILRYSYPGPPVKASFERKNEVYRS
jgi:hypothetical protein